MSLASFCHVIQSLPSSSQRHKHLSEARVERALYHDFGSYNCERPDPLTLAFQCFDNSRIAIEVGQHRVSIFRRHIEDELVKTLIRATSDLLDSRNRAE